jgi:HEAT repeat-containing protein 5
MPVLTSYEHDSLGLYQTRSQLEYISETPPPATGVVDAAIQLFAHILPLQDTAACVRAVTQLVDSVKSPKLERNAGRKAAVFVNSAISILMSLRASATLPSNHIRENLGSAQVTTVLSSFLKVSL